MRSTTDIEKLIPDFQGISPGGLILSLAALVALGDAHRIDIRSRIRPVLALIQPHIGFPIPAGIIADAELPSRQREDEIRRLYAELRELAESNLHHDASTEAHYQQCLVHLRTLQQEEAREMEASFEANRLLPRGAVDRIIERADALLRNHEDPPQSDQPGNRSA